MIPLTYGILEEIQPGAISLSSWVLAAYGIGIWFFIQRWLTIWGLCKWYNVKPKKNFESINKCVQRIAAKGGSDCGDDLHGVRDVDRIWRHGYE